MHFSALHLAASVSMQCTGDTLAMELRDMQHLHVTSTSRRCFDAMPCHRAP